MSALRAFSYIVAIVSAVACSILAFRIRRLGLGESYKAFYWYLLCESFGILSITFLNLTNRQTLAASVFIGVQVIDWPIYIWVVIELFNKVFERYPGLSQLARRILIAGLAISLLLSFSFLQADMQSSRHQSETILIVTAIQRAVVGSLSLFLLALTAILVYMPVVLAPNTILHGILLFLYFLVMTVGHLYRNITGSDVTITVNIGLAILTNLCLFVWLFRLRTEGERQPAVSYGPGPAESHWLISHLEQINRILVRPVK